MVLDLVTVAINCNSADEPASFQKHLNFLVMHTERIYQRPQKKKSDGDKERHQASSHTEYSWIIYFTKKKKKES